MIRFLHSQTRIQVEGQTPVLNIAMPIEAAPQPFNSRRIESGVRTWWHVGRGESDNNRTTND